MGVNLNILKRYRKNGNQDRVAATKAKPLLKPLVKRYYVELLLILALALVITFMFPRGKSFQYADLREGQVYLDEQVIATFTFPVLKSPEEYESDKKNARESVVPVFVINPDLKANELNELSDFANRIKVNLKGKMTTIANIKAHYIEAGIVISDDDVNLLLNAFESTANTGKSKDTGPRVAKFEKVTRKVMALLEELYTAGILDRSKESFPTYVNKIRVRRNDGIEEEELLQYYLDSAEAAAMLLEMLREDDDFDEKEVKIAYAIGEHFITPNVLIDEVETKARIEQVEENVPLAKDQVLDGERIIDSHEVVTKSHIEKLNSYAVAKAERVEMEGFWRKLPPSLGKFFLVLSILTILAIYLFSDRRSIFNDRKKLLLIGLNILLVAILTFISNRFQASVYNSAYFIPVSALSLIITIFFDTRVGLFVTLTAALLIGALRGNEYAITFTSLFVGAIAVQTVRKVRTRIWIIRSGLIISAAYIFTILVNGLVTYADFSDTWRNWWIGILNGFLSPGIAYLLIIILESMFDLTTDMTLLELSDFNHPLLRQLHLEAPGTYHHCYLVGMLAEAATEALGGNALLARVGSYYHDIGKLEKPEYFVENQTKGRNPQEKLTPTMSSLILANHVRRGAEIAREYGLPKEIEAFIYQHHGTSLMAYFYQKALEQGNDDSLSEDEFRYPGPRPQTRETAIVMMADAIEAASRTLKDPTPSRIKGLVEQIIDERFKSGELDESPLTLQDLSKISNAFQKILIARFHGRIEYPKSSHREAIKSVRAS